MKISTKCAQAGVPKEEKTGCISTPIYQSATFRHPALGESTGYDYSRSGNPTRQALENAIAALEGGKYGVAFSSGMAAVDAFMHLFSPGDHLVVSNDLYGGTYRLLEQLYAAYGIKVSYTDTGDISQVEQALCEDTRALLVETPTNPMMKVSDIGALSGLARKHQLILAVDNTFMTPYWQRPLELGADVVIHSASKYLGGHNDLIAGLIVVDNDKLGERLRFVQNSVGAILGPQDSWLLLRGLKTLAVRLEKSQQNALVLARWLKNHAKIKAVFYPGLTEHPGYQIMKHNASGYGAMISFELFDATLIEQVLRRVRLISFAESLGGVETLITFPAQQTHADIPVEVRRRLGINDSLLRLSVGIEHVDDLIDDLARALTGEED